MVGLGATLSASGSYSVAIGSSTGASGQGFASSGGSGSQSSGTSYSPALSAVPPPNLLITSAGQQIALENFNGTVISGGTQCAHITPDPAMPNVALSVVPSNGTPILGSVNWSMQVTYSRGDPAQTVDQQLIQPSGAATIPVATPWYPYAPTNTFTAAGNPGSVMFQGGAATVTWSFANTSGNHGTFCIDGLNGNPDPSAVKQFASATSSVSNPSSPEAPFWAMPKLIAQESSYLEFCPDAIGTCSSQKLADGQPLRAKDFGYGIMQLTSGPPYQETIWNWQINVLYGWLSYLQPNIVTGANNWSTSVKNYILFLTQGNLPSAPPNDPEGSPNSYCTFTYAPSTGPNTYSFADAIGLKRYNGLGNVQPVADYETFNTSTDQWVFTPNSITYHPSTGVTDPPYNYVGAVCSHSDTY